MSKHFFPFALLTFSSQFRTSFSAHGDEMARSDFHFGAEDWEVFGPGQLKLHERNGVLYGSDVGRTVWYFSAPSKFLGDKSFSHNGKFSFRLGHSEYMSNGKDMIKDWDVILESKEWRLRVGIRNLIPPWVGATNNDISLSEKSWTVIKGPGHGHSPTEIQMLRLLSSLSAIYIRGGYYEGHEESWIDSVIMQEGDHHIERMQRKVNKHHHEPLRKKKEQEDRKRREQEIEMLVSAGQLPPPQLHSAPQQPPSLQFQGRRLHSASSPPSPPQPPNPSPFLDTKDVQDDSGPGTSSGGSEGITSQRSGPSPEELARTELARAARAAPRLVPSSTREKVETAEGVIVEDKQGSRSSQDTRDAHAAEEAADLKAKAEAEAAEKARAEEARAEAEAEVTRARAERERVRAEADAARAKAEAEAANAKAEAEAAKAKAEAEAARVRVEAEAAAARVRAEAEAAHAAKAKAEAEAIEKARRDEAAAMALAQAEALAEEKAVVAAAENARMEAQAKASAETESNPQADVIEMREADQGSNDGELETELVGRK